jgi:beta-glucanase (GH16 family)
MTIDPTNLSSTATLTWSDEFDTLNLWNGTSGWNTNYWWGDANGSTLAGNGEEEWYIDHRYAPTTAAIAAGKIVNPWMVETVTTNGVTRTVLTLTAAPVTDLQTQSLINGYDYSSGEINSYSSFSQLYGYFEMSAKLPEGQGLWPAFWLLPADGSWPPEIDIMEVLGHDPTTLHNAVHYNGRGGRHMSAGTSTTVADMSADFHVYGVDWQADTITWYFDGQQVYQTATPAGLNEPMYILANLAVGGNWPGSPNSSTVFPAEYQIDYIRVYADAGLPDPDPTSPLFTLSISQHWTYVVPGNRIGRGDTLIGTSGADLLDGSSGEVAPRIDVFKGGAGDDTYMVDRANDKVDENANAGIDTVLSTSPTFKLAVNVENLTLVGSTAQTGTGNALDNILTSNDFGSMLSGGDGRDILIAGLRADTLTGGAGTDIFRFESSTLTAAGHVTDYAAGDMLDLRALFTGVIDPAVALSHIIFDDTPAGTQVFFDADGAGGSSATLIVTLDNYHVDVVGPLTMQTDWFYQ